MYKSKFRLMVEEAIRQHDNSTIVIEPRSYEELLHIFALDEQFQEDANNIQTLLYLANQYYKKIKEKIHAGNYEIKPSGVMYIELDEFDIYIDTGNIGGYHRSSLNLDDLRISLYAKDLRYEELCKDELFKSNLVHELTHYLSQHEDDAFALNHYIRPKSDGSNVKEYSLQQTEFLSNEVAICDFIIHRVLGMIDANIKKDDIKTKQTIQEFVDALIYTTCKDPLFIYSQFIRNLKKDETAFRDFYEEIIKACVGYIQRQLHLFESLASLNNFTDTLKNIVEGISDDN